MRKYTPKDDVQKKSYFTDRFFITPSIPRSNPSEDEIFANDLENLDTALEVLESYVEAGHLVIYIKPEDNKKAITFLKEQLDYDFLMELSAIDYIKDRELQNTKESD